MFVRHSQKLRVQRFCSQHLALAESGEARVHHLSIEISEREGEEREGQEGPSSEGEWQILTSDSAAAAAAAAAEGKKPVLEG